MSDAGAAQHQRAGRYDPASTEHPGKMLPDLAGRIVENYSHPGDLVVDPMCGIGMTLVEGAAMGAAARASNSRSAGPSSHARTSIASSSPEAGLWRGPRR